MGGQDSVNYGKLKLSKFLFGKNHCLITYPLFLYFIKQKENEYLTETYNNENELIIQNKKFKKLKKLKIKNLLKGCKQIGI